MILTLCIVGAALLACGVGGRVFEALNREGALEDDAKKMFGAREVWIHSADVWSSEGTDPNLLTGEDLDELLETHLRSRGILVRGDDDLPKIDPPALIALEKKTPRIYIAAGFEVMKTGENAYAFSLRVEAGEMGHVARTKREDYFIVWNRSLLGCAAGSDLRSLMAKTVTECLDSFADAFLMSQRL